MTNPRGRRSLAALIFGAQPGRNATRLERLVWVRDACLRLAPIFVFLVAVAAFTGAPLLIWLLIVLFTAPWFLVVVSISSQISSERHNRKP